MVRLGGKANRHPILSHFKRLSLRQSFFDRSWHQLQKFEKKMVRVHLSRSHFLCSGISSLNCKIKTSINQASGFTPMGSFHFMERGSMAIPMMTSFALQKGGTCSPLRTFCPPLQLFTCKYQSSRSKYHHSMYKTVPATSDKDYPSASLRNAEFTLSKRGIPFANGHCHLIAPCVICCNYKNGKYRKAVEERNQWTMFINKTTGSYACCRCGILGGWKDLRRVGNVLF